MTILRITTLALATLILAGCSVLPKPEGAVAGPFYKPSNVKALARLPATIRRVIVLPVSGGPALTEETLLKLDSVCVGMGQNGFSR